VLALGLAVVGAVINWEMNSDIATVFRTTYVIGAVGAVCLVRRRNLFGPMVAPPLILVVVVPLVAAALDNKPGSKVLVIGPLLINNFPVMAITTGVTVVLGGIRYLAQRRPANDSPSGDRDRPRRPERPDRARIPSSRDRDPADRPSTGSRGARPSGGSRSDQDRGLPRDRTRVDPGRGRSGSGDRGGRDVPRGRDGRDRDLDRGQSRNRAPRDAPRREPRRRDDDY